MGMTWVLIKFGHKLSAMGACIGAVVGLVAITPGAGFVTIPHAFLLVFLLVLSVI
jgi:Amt family ammonium transporter